MKIRRLQPATEVPNRVSGTYKTTRDGGLDYGYSAIWEFTPLGVVWRAEVTRNGRVVGEPRAIFWRGGIDYTAQLHKVIGRYIENRWMVE